MHWFGLWSSGGRVKARALSLKTLFYVLIPELKQLICQQYFFLYKFHIGEEFMIYVDLYIQKSFFRVTRDKPSMTLNQATRRAMDTFSPFGAWLLWHLCWPWALLPGFQGKEKIQQTLLFASTLPQTVWHSSWSSFQTQRLSIWISMVCCGIWYY